MKKDLLKCPRCKGIAFCEFECGPDEYEDDISYTSQICLKCKLYHSGWTNKWLIDCEWWTDEENAAEYITPQRQTKHTPGETIRFRVGLWISPDGKTEQVGEIISVHHDNEHNRDYYRVHVAERDTATIVLEHEIIECLV